MITSKDFLAEYQNCAHPGDYNIRQDTPPAIAYVHHHDHGRHNKLICRMPWVLTTDTYFMMSFIVDTGAPRHLYLSSTAMSLLEENGVIHKDNDIALTYVILNGR